MKIILPFNDEIPDRYTQYGLNISPEISFEDVPEDAETLVIFIDNKNAPSSKANHWTIWNIPADTSKIPEHIENREKPDKIDAVQGNNDFSILGYHGPKLFPEEEHYIFTAYALNTELNLNSGNNKEQVIEAMKGHVIDKATTERGYTQ